MGYGHGSFSDDQMKELLEWINEVRTEIQKRDPIEKLPKGNKGFSQSCPIAQALNGEYTTAVGQWSGYTFVDGKEIMLELPSVASTFVQEFDYGHLPEFDLEFS